MFSALAPDMQQGMVPVTFLNGPGCSFCFSCSVRHGQRWVVGGCRPRSITSIEPSMVQSSPGTPTQTTVQGPVGMGECLSHAPASIKHPAPLISSFGTYICSEGPPTSTLALSFGPHHDRQIRRPERVTTSFPYRFLFLFGLRASLELTIPSLHSYN